MTKLIRLSNGMSTLVDDNDYDSLAKFKWSAGYRRTSKSYYALRTSTMNEREAGKKITILMHREILNAPNGLQVDHKNHDTLDNRRANLRLATMGQNQANQRPQIARTSVFKGVSYCKLSHQWRAFIKANGKRRSLGHYRTEHDAALAYNRAASELFGEYAFLNSVDHNP